MHWSSGSSGLVLVKHTILGSCHVMWVHAWSSSMFVWVKNRSLKLTFLAEIAKFSTGCVYHFPNYHCLNDVVQVSFKCLSSIILEVREKGPKINKGCWRYTAKTTDAACPPFCISELVFTLVFTISQFCDEPLEPNLSICWGSKGASLQ